jgi:small nuclear ribonucleoprotein
MTSKKPLEILQRSVDSEILVQLKDGTQYLGTLLETDTYMNMVLADAKEIGHDNQMVARFGEIFVRGNNILYVKPNNAIL